MAPGEAAEPLITSVVGFALVLGVAGPPVVGRLTLAAAGLGVGGACPSLASANLAVTFSSYTEGLGLGGGGVVDR
jgi:hypothetical protein